MGQHILHRKRLFAQETERQTEETAPQPLLAASDQQDPLFAGPQPAAGAPPFGHHIGQIPVFADQHVFNSVPPTLSDAPAAEAADTSPAAVQLPAVEWQGDQQVPAEETNPTSAESVRAAVSTAMPDPSIAAATPGPRGVPITPPEAASAATEPIGPAATPSPLLEVAASLGQPADALDGLKGVRLSGLDVTMRAVAEQIAAPAPGALQSGPVPVAPPQTLAPPEAATAQPEAPQLTTTPAPAGQPIEHEPTSVTAQPPAEKEAISAGPRPKVPLTGPTDPQQTAATVHGSQAQVDSQLATANAATTGDLGLARLDEPLHIPPTTFEQVPIPSALAVPPIPEAPWRMLPPAAQANLDALVAPGLEQRIGALAGRAQREAEEVHGQLTVLQSEHDSQIAAATEAAQTQIDALRDTGTTQVDSLRGEWQAQNQAARDECTQQIAAEHAAVEAEVQETVRVGEQRSDAILSGAESDATAKRSAAEARVQAIQADAQARAAAARNRSGPDVTIMRQEDPQGEIEAQGAGDEAEAQRILAEAQEQAQREIEQAMREIDNLISNARGMSEEEIEHRLLLINARITRLRAELNQAVDQALGERFPLLESIYTDQIDTLLRDIRSRMFLVADNLFAGNIEAAARTHQQSQQLIDSRTERLQMTLQDAAVLSTFEDVDSALDAFGITMDTSDLIPDDDQSPAWRDTDRQRVLGQAIRIENAFRDADQDGLFAEAGLTEPGAAFNAIMNGGRGIHLTRVHERNEDGSMRGGAYTAGAGQINFYSLTSPERSDWMADATMFHFGHEFGHAFNSTIIGAANGDPDDRWDLGDVPYTNSDEGRFAADGIRDQWGNLIAGGTAQRYIPTDEELERLQALSPERWTRWVELLSERQGMRTGTATLESDYEYLRMLPYQQNASASNGEWFADLFSNWANGTLADTNAGGVVDEWMDDQMQDWIRMRLEANGVEFESHSGGGDGARNR